LQNTSLPISLAFGVGFAFLAVFAGFLYINYSNGCVGGVSPPTVPLTCSKLTNATTLIGGPVYQAVNLDYSSLLWWAIAGALIGIVVAGTGQTITLRRARRAK
jgi:hypothetical protein